MLDVEDHLGDVLFDPGNRGELVEHTVDAQARDRGSRYGREECPAHGVAQGVAEAGLEGLENETRSELADRLFGENRALRDEHG